MKMLPNFNNTQEILIYLREYVPMECYLLTGQLKKADSSSFCTGMWEETFLGTVN